MDNTTRNILLTGTPGCGKTTVIESLVRILDLPATGFLTREQRDAEGRRTGFIIETLDGRSGTLARVGTAGRHRVGRYVVDLESVDNIAAPSIDHLDERPVIVIDEIGKMECFSRSFCEAVEAALDSEKIVIGTISLGGHPFIRKIRQRRDVSLVKVDPKNRDQLPDELVASVRTLL